MLKIDFVDFWPNFLKNDNYFYHLLKTQHAIEIDEINPDIVFCSCYSNHKQKYVNHQCKKVFYTGENHGLLCHNGENWIETPFNYDLTLTFDETDGKNVYFPLFVMFLNWFNVPHDDNRDISFLHNIDDLLNPIVDVDAILKNKNRFCSFIVGNPTSKYRIKFCEAVQKLAPVDCPGKVLNNCTPIGGRGDQKHKIDFLKNYRFNIAFENSLHPGYVTEKILHALATRCIPIYWGGSKVSKYFSENAFILIDDDFNKTINKMLQIDSDKDLYIEMIKNPVMNFEVIHEFTTEKIIEHINRIL